jgi:hypothetical protein
MTYNGRVLPGEQVSPSGDGHRTFSTSVTSNADRPR